MTHAHADTAQTQRDRDVAERCCILIMRYWAVRGHPVKAWYKEETLSSGNGTYCRIYSSGIPPGAKE